MTDVTNIFATMASQFVGNVAATSYQSTQNSKLEARDSPDAEGAMVVADNYTVRKYSPHRHLPLEEKCLVPLFLYTLRNGSTAPIKILLTDEMTNITSIRLLASVIEGYSATPSYLLNFRGSSGICTGMNSQGHLALGRTSLLLPSAVGAIGESLEIARWKNGDGKMEYVIIDLTDASGSPITWTSISLWLQVEKSVWY